MTDPTFDPPLPPLDVPSWRKVWAEAEPSFRGAVIGAMQERKQIRMQSAGAMLDRAFGDPDVLSLCERQMRLVQAEEAAIEILREAAK